MYSHTVVIDELIRSGKSVISSDAECDHVYHYETTLIRLQYVFTNNKICHDENVLFTEDLIKRLNLNNMLYHKVEADFLHLLQSQAM